VVVCLHYMNFSDVSFAPGALLLLTEKFQVFRVNLMVVEHILQYIQQVEGDRIAIECPLDDSVNRKGM
jgi:hypothetical protein